MTRTYGEPSRFADQACGSTRPLSWPSMRCSTAATNGEPMNWAKPTTSGSSSVYAAMAFCGSYPWSRTVSSIFRSQMPPSSFVCLTHSCCAWVTLLPSEA